MSDTLNASRSTSVQSSSASHLFWFHSTHFISENSYMSRKRTASSVTCEGPGGGEQWTGLCDHVAELFLGRMRDLKPNIVSVDTVGPKIQHGSFHKPKSAGFNSQQLEKDGTLFSVVMCLCLFPANLCYSWPSLLTLSSFNLLELASFVNLQKERYIFQENNESGFQFPDNFNRLSVFYFPLQTASTQWAVDTTCSFQNSFFNHSLYDFFL